MKSALPKSPPKTLALLRGLTGFLNELDRQRTKTAHAEVVEPDLA
jgi:hypothetical protein